jgi:glycosyltransferase involved in cell wall biosynthesis
MPIIVSFIIPHKGRIELLTQTIESILCLDYDLSQIEIIIVTQNSDLDASLFDIGNSEHLKIIKQPEQFTISTLRNIGVKKSEGEFLAFLDADIALSENWLSTMLALLDTPKFILVSASQTNSPGAPALERIRTTLSNAELDVEVNFLPGRNLLLRKVDFYKVGGFPEHLVTCEDYYFTDQLSHFGKLFYSSLSEYIHLGEDKVYLEMFKKEIWRGQSNLLSIKGRKIPLREIPSIIVPMIIVFSLIFSAIAIATGHFILSLLSLFVSASLFLIYVIRLIKLANGEIRAWNIVKFYLYYFPARSYGTIAGLFLSLGIKK